MPLCPHRAVAEAPRYITYTHINNEALNATQLLRHGHANPKHEGTLVEQARQLTDRSPDLLAGHRGRDLCQTGLGLSIAGQHCV